MARKNAVATKEALESSTFEVSNQILLQNSPSKSSPPQALFFFFCSFSAQSRSRSFFNHFALAATFAWIPVPGVPAAGFYRCPLHYSICTLWFPDISF